MRKAMVLILVFILIVSSIGATPVKVQDQDKVTPSNIIEDIMETVDYGENDFDFTEEEREAIKKYQNEQLIFANYQCGFYGESIEINGKSCEIGTNDLYLRILRKVLNVNIIEQKMDFDDALNGVYQGDVDFMFQIKQTKERAERASFSEPIFTRKIYFYGKQGKNFNMVHHLDDAIICQVEGTKFLPDDFIERHNVHIIYKPSIADCIRFEEENRDNIAFVGIVSSLSNQLLLQGYDYSIVDHLFKANNASIMYANDEDLEPIISAFAKVLERNNDQILGKFSEDYVNMKVALGEYFTKEERALIEKTKSDPLKIWIYNNHSLESERVDGVWQGRAIEYFGAVSDYIGWHYETIDKLNYQPDEPLDQQHFDIILGCRLLGKYTRFIPAKSYAKGQLVIVGDHQKDAILSLGELKGKVLVYDSVVTIHFIKDYMRGIDYYVPSGMQEFFQEYETGEYDYYLFPDEMTFYYASKRMNVKDRGVKYYTEEESAFAPLFYRSEENETMHNIYNKSFNIVRLGDIDQKYHAGLSYSALLDIERYEISNKQLVFAMLAVCTLLMIVLILAYFTHRASRNVRRASEIMYQESRKDELTDLYNRRKFLEDYQANQNPNSFLAFIDVNKFKLINDAFGHDFGDMVLIEIANRLKKIPNSVPYRLAGDEFLLMLNDTFSETFTIDDMVSMLAGPIYNENIGFSKNVTLSMGIVKGNRNQMGASDMMALADLAMYEAKRKNILYTLVDDASLDRYQEKIAMDKAFVEAVNNNALFSYYQPIIDVKKGIVIGVEVFSRWRYKGEIIPAIPFMDMDKRLNIVSMIDKEIKPLLAKAKGRNMLIWVNISPEYLHYIANNMPIEKERDANVEKKSRDIVFEISEQEELDENARIAVDKLYDMGFQFAIDHYGDGVRNLTHEYNWKFEYFKTDISLLPKNKQDESGILLFKQVINFLQKIGKMTVITGVETKEQLDIALACNVGYVQGDYFSTAVDENEILRLVDKQYEISVNGIEDQEEGECVL